MATSIIDKQLTEIVERGTGGGVFTSPVGTIDTNANSTYIYRYGNVVIFGVIVHLTTACSAWSTIAEMSGIVVPKYQVLFLGAESGTGAITPNQSRTGTQISISQSKSAGQSAKIMGMFICS